MNQTALRIKWESRCSSIFGMRAPGEALRALIREDESALDYDRNNIRASAKIGLIDRGSSLGAADILLARDHFGKLVPMGWGGG